MNSRLPVRSARTHDQQGFILLSVIAILVVLVLLAAATATTTNRVRADQGNDDVRLAGEVDGYSTRATVLYLLGTQRLTFGGLTVDNQIKLTADEQSSKDESEGNFSNMPVGNEVRLDNSPYQGLGTSEFALQDDHGRISVNWSNPALLERWLINLKIPMEQQGPLFAKLLDYQDPDDTYRINGAEADRYRAANRVPPPNRALTTPLELRHVLDWDKALAGLDDGQLLDRVTVARSAQINVNTAPASVLELLPGVTADMAVRVVAMRQLQAFYQYWAVYELLPAVPPDLELVSLHPGGSGSITVWPDAGAAGSLLHWTLTPFDDGGHPWRIDYELRLPARPRSERTPVREAATPLLANPTVAHPR